MPKPVTSASRIPAGAAVRPAGFRSVGPEWHFRTPVDPSCWTRVGGTCAVPPALHLSLPAGFEPYMGREQSPRTQGSWSQPCPGYPQHSLHAIVHKASSRTQSFRVAVRTAAQPSYEMLIKPGGLEVDLVLPSPGSPSSLSTWAPQPFPTTLRLTRVTCLGSGTVQRRQPREPSFSNAGR